MVPQTIKQRQPEPQLLDSTKVGKKVAAKVQETFRKDDNEYCSRNYVIGSRGIADRSRHQCVQLICV